MSSFLFSLMPLPDVEQGIRDLEEILLIGAGRVSYPGGGDVTYSSPEQIKSHLRALYERRAVLVGGRRRSGMSLLRIVRQSGY